MNKYQFGQIVVANENSTVKAGTVGKIIDLWQDGAFWKYEIAWRETAHFITVAREKDIDLNK